MDIVYRLEFLETQHLVNCVRFYHQIPGIGVL
jgi:hypothetical protein